MAVTVTTTVAALAPGRAYRGSSMPRKPESLSLESLGIPVPPPFVPRPEILLHPNIPRPLHGVAPREILGREWWDRVRAEAKQKTAGKCTACSASPYDLSQRKYGPKWLEGHELYSIDYVAGRMTYLETVVLCHYCHCFIHDGRTRIMYETGRMMLEMYVTVVTHGQQVLTAAKLRSPKAYTGPCAEWAKWRMVLDGVEYPPKYATEAEWAMAFRKGE